MKVILDSGIDYAVASKRGLLDQPSSKAIDLGELAHMFVLAEKALPKGARVWRIDGSHHEIPTAETIGDRDIVLCQWQSGSEALNLQYLHIWVSLEPHYAYSTSVQARGRIRRLGQQKHMIYLYLECDKAIEGDVYEILRNKGEFSAKNWAIKNNLIKEKE